MGVGGWEFFECEVWDFGDDVIDGWFEWGWGEFVGDFVVEFI